jgi:acetyltransferase
VNEIAEVFQLAEVLGKQPRPAGPRLGIVTNAGGPGVLATDALVASGGELATLGDDTLARLSGALPAAWSHGNPVDVLGDADPARYARALEIAAADPGSDGLLVILTPQDMTDPTLTAEALRGYASLPGGAERPGKPLLASWMGGAQVAAGIDILNRAGIPTFEFPDHAARTFAAMWRYADNLRGLYETAVRAPDGDVRREEGRAVIAAALGEGRTLLDEHESKALLASHGIPTTPTKVARDEDAAVAAARALGFPAVVKLWSRSITHKTDVGGVKLGLGDDAAVARAFRDIREAVAARAGAEHFLGVTVQPQVRRGDGYELILGSAPDPQFGPVLLFGMGGELVEVFRDRALALPPLTSTLARRMMERTRIYQALRGVRGRAPVDLAALEALLVRFGDLVASEPRIREIDINPLLASPEAIVALDARVVLYDASTPDADLPRPAIRPYPSEYVARASLRDGTSIVVRPIRPDDEPRMVPFHRALSEDSVRLRYMQTMKLDERTAHERLQRICFADYDRELALVAEDPQGQILAVGRLSRDRAPGPAGDRGAEFSLLVADPWQGQGLGRELLGRLVDVGRRERLSRIYADVLASNLRMQRLCTRFGFTIGAEDGGVVRAELRL